MEEDEEIVHKNSGLYTCLVEAGFHDFESIDKTDLKFDSSSAQETVESFESYHRNGKYYANLKEYASYIQACLRSKLVFADDAYFVEHYTASSNVSPSGSLIFSTLKVVSCSAIGIAFSTCRFLRTNIPPIVFWSLHVIPLAICSIRFSYHSYQKFRRQKIVNRLLSTLKELSLFVQKSIQFVQNCAVLASISDRSHVNYEESAYLQEILFNTLRSAILELKSATVSFVKDYPLKEAVESHQYYLASLSNEDLHCVHPNERTSPEYLQKMKYSYFLLQSEYLRRLCLCLVPSLQLQFCEASTLRLFERLTATADVCAQLCQRLKARFEMHYLMERRSHETRRRTNASWAYREAYVKVCSLSSNLQSVLRQSRRLEEMLEELDVQEADDDLIVASLDAGARRIDGEYAKCHSALDDFQRYVCSLRPKRHEPAPVELPAQPEANKTNIVVGISDFRPQWPDEVFVGTSEAGQPEELHDAQSESASNPCAKLLISELKMALRDKAQEWKKREREALRNKDMAEPDSEEELPVIKEPTTERRPPPTIVVAPASRDLGLTESSLAKQIAAASASWQMREEQHFSFGDDSDEDSESCDEML